MRLLIPITPVPWSAPQYRIARKKDGKQFVQSYSPARMRTYQKQLRAFVSRFRITPGPVAVQILFWMPRPKSVRRPLPCVKPDLDNLTKCFCDACNGLLWEDDARICRLNVEKRYVEDGEWPGVVAEVKAMADVTAEFPEVAT